jgi:hypothetical protein
MATAILENDFLDFLQSGIVQARITASDEATLTFSGVSSALVKLSGLAAPVDTADAATKLYTDSLVHGISWKPSVKVATTEVVDFDIFSDTPGTVQIDGITLVDGDRILVKDQTDGTNGIYVYRNDSYPDRADDMLESSSARGAAVFVQSGSNTDCAFVCINDKGADEVGYDRLYFSIFARIGEITAGDGLTRSGNNLYVNVDDSTLEISGDALRAKDAGITNDKLMNSSVTLTAGDGLDGGGSVSLGDSLSFNINVDDSSIQIYSNTLRIKNSGASTDKIDDAAVTTDKLGNSAVTTGKIDATAVITDKLDNGAVTTDKLDEGSVTTEKIDAASVTTGKIDASAVTNNKIVDANVTNAKLANSSLTVSAGTGLGDGGLVSLGGSVSLSVNVDDSSIEIDADGVRIKDLGVTTAKINDAAVTTAKIDASAATNNKLANPGLSVLAGAGLGGGGSVDLGGSVTLSLNVDGSSIEIDADAIRVKDLGVTTSKINNAAVTTLKIDDAAVTEDKLAASAVTTAKLNDAAVTEDKLAASAVTTAKINDASVTNAKLANSSLSATAGAGLKDGGSVSLGGAISLSVNVDDTSIAINGGTVCIKDLGVSTEKISNAAVTTDKINNAAITNAKLANSSLSVLAGAGLGDGGSADLGGSVTLSINVDDSSIEINADALRVKDLGVTTAKIDDAAVTTVKINDAAVTTAKVAASAVTTTKILDANVTEDKLATSAVTTTKILDANVTNAKLANSSLSVIAGAGLGDGGSVSLSGELLLSVNVDGSSIEINTDALQIKDLGITTAKINNASVTTAKIDGYAATNDKLANSSLSVLAGSGLGGGGSVALGSTVSLSVNTDDSSLEINTDAVQIKDLGVSTAKISDAAVTTAKFSDESASTAKIANLAIGTAKILDANVTNVKLSNSSVTVTADDGLQSGGSVALGSSVSLAVNNSVVRTTGAQSVGGAKTFTSATIVSDATASSSTSTGCLKLAGGLGVAEKIYAGSDMYGVAFIATSDVTLKTDIAPISGALQKIVKIDPVEFKFNFVENDCTHYGVLAQQLQESGFDFMVERAGEHLSVEYNSLTGLLLAAVKDLSAEVNRLESILI